MQLVKIIFCWYFGYAISSNLTFFAYSSLLQSPQLKLRERKGRRERRGSKKGQEGKGGREGKGRV